MSWADIILTRTWMCPAITMTTLSTQLVKTYCSPLEFCLYDGVDYPGAKYHWKMLKVADIFVCLNL